MKNLLFVILISAVTLSCNSNQEAMKKFEDNTKTMDVLFESFTNESVDYSKFADDIVFKGTVIGAPDSIGLSEINVIHKEMFDKYDFKYMAPMNYLIGVNADTGITDGSVRMYYDMEVTLPATDSTEEKSVVVPIYESFDFNEDGKAVYVQWYCDWTGHLASLED